MPDSPQWNPTTRTLVLSALVVGGLWFVYYARVLIPPLLVGGILAFFLAPLAALLEQRTGWSRRRASLLVYLFFLIFALVLPVAVAPILLRQAADLSRQITTALSALDAAAVGLSLLGVRLFPSGVSPGLNALAAEVIVPERLFHTLRGATENAVWLLVIVFMVYYFLRDGGRMRSWGISLIPIEQRADARALYRRIARVWRVFFHGQLAVMLWVGVLAGAAAALAGLPGPGVLAGLATLLAILPSIGSTFVMLAAATLAWFAPANAWGLPPLLATLLALALFAVVHRLEVRTLRPRIMGAQATLHPAVVLVATIGALTVSGVLVALIIVPLLRSGEILARYLARRALGEDPWVSPL